MAGWEKIQPNAVEAEDIVYAGNGRTANVIGGIMRNLPTLWELNAHTNIGSLSS